MAFLWLNILIDYERLRKLLGLDSYDRVIPYHKRWGDDYLENGHGVLLLVVEVLLIGYNPYWGLWLSREKVSKQENPINFGSLLFRIMPVLGSKRAI